MRARSASSTARTTKTCWWCACTSWCRNRSGRSATTRSTISSACSPTTACTIVKFLLYISKDEQAKRFRERLDDKTKNWKFSPADIKEREYWDQYIEAYEEMLRKCSTEKAPWYVIPANKKWFRNLAVSQILCDALEGMDLKFPKPTADLSGIKFE